MPWSGHVRAILVLGLPIIGTHLGQMAIGVTDTVMLGWYGAEALAAVGIAATLLHLLMLVGSGFAWAVLPMVAAFAAEGNETQVRRATRMGMWLSLIYGTLALPPLIFSGPILLALGQSEAIAADAQSYLRIAGWGIVPMLLVMVLKSYLAALEHTRPVLYIILGSAVLNGLCNWAFIFGNWGAPELGIVGAAWASNATQLFALIGVTIYAVRALPEHQLFVRLWKSDWQMFRRVFSLGWPISLTTLSEAGLFSASALMMGWLGTIPLAAHTVVVQLASITFMVHLGLSNAATVRAGNAFGRRDRDHLVRGVWVVMIMSLMFASATVAAFLLMPETLISIFLDADDPALPEILSIGIVLLALGALFQTVDGAQVIALGALRGVQDTQIPMYMAAISYWGVGMPSSYLFGFVLGWGAAGVWTGLVTGLACAAVLLVGRFWRTASKRVTPHSV
ncbi:MATE family efflux transporter [Aliishimia ponticola]|uniref:Multidrug-efflux transporter n=2 Tax=Aliishimia ponticola TaxID=2499833 RepID=A0A4S4NAB1_9RHOB|nr:MATE family efflux transporter [Aliishimia ponticola]